MLCRDCMATLKARFVALAKVSALFNKPTAAIQVLSEHEWCHSKCNPQIIRGSCLPRALRRPRQEHMCMEVTGSSRRYCTSLIESTEAPGTCDAARGHSSSSTSRHDTALRWLCGVVPNSLGSLYVLGVDRSRLSKSALPSRAASKELPDLAVPEGDVTVLGTPLRSCSRNRVLSYKPHSADCVAGKMWQGRQKQDIESMKVVDTALSEARKLYKR